MYAFLSIELQGFDTSFHHLKPSIPVNRRITSAIERAKISTPIIDGGRGFVKGVRKLFTTIAKFKE